MDLVTFVKNGDIYKVRELVEKNMKNDIDKAFFFAIDLNNILIVKYLYKNGADIKKDDYITIAAFNGNLKILQFLVENGANMENINDAFISAIRERHFSVVKYLFEIGASITEEAISYSASDGYKKIIHFLIENGGNKNVALINSLDIETIKYLIENGADIHYDNENIFLRCAIRGNLEMMKYLVENGANIHFNEEEALFLSFQYSNFKTTKFLIENGADIRARSDFFVKGCAQNGNLNFLIFLLDKIQDSNLERICFNCACESGRMNVVKYFVEKNINIHNDNEYGFRISAKNNHLDVVAYLLNRGADIHAENDEALRKSVEKEHYQLVYYLIKKGANTAILDYDMKMKYGVKIEWEKKPDNLLFRESDECPISKKKFTKNVKKLGCSKCLNVFDKNTLIDWLKIKNECPLCRETSIFYLQ